MSRHGKRWTVWRSLPDHRDAYRRTIAAESPYRCAPTPVEAAQGHARDLRRTAYGEPFELPETETWNVLPWGQRNNFHAKPIRVRVFPREDFRAELEGGDDVS